MNFKTCCALAALTLAAAATPALADVTVIQGNVPGNLQTVQFDGPDQGNTVLGSINPSNTIVVFSSNEGINAPSMGQARLEADDNGLNFLNISLQDPTLGFTQAEFNLNAAIDGPVSIVAFDSDGNAFGTGHNGVGTFTLDGNGQNFFNLVAMNQEAIVRFQIASADGLDDIRQVRFGGVAPIDEINPPTSIPEPASWGLMILGFGGLGGLLRRRRATVLCA